jgi:hypothetical protein
MNGNELFAAFGAPEAQLAQYPGITPEQRAAGMGDILEAWMRGSGGAGLGLAQRTGMVDPRALAQMQEPVRRRTMEMGRELEEADRLRRYKQMYLDMQQARARSGELAQILSGIGSVAGGIFGGPGGAGVGGALGQLLGGLG